MPRPRKDDTRKHQLNIRFTPREFARVHHHAGLLGKTPTDFARSAMLRRPRRKRDGAPVVIAVSERLLCRWHQLGSALNGLAHRFNAGGDMPATEIAKVLSALRRLIKQSLPEVATVAAGAQPYSLTPALRYHLRKTCTNLVQVSERCRALGLPSPTPLSNLICRFRTVLNGDRPPHGA